MPSKEAVRETKNFIRSQAKVHEVNITELMKEVKKELEEGESGRKSSNTG